MRQELAGDGLQTSTTYEPYGKLLARTGTSGTVYGFTGEQEDAATGLLYLRARYYNPSLKVFMSRDPFPGMPTMPATQHGYSYAHNNPVNLTDPTGETPLALALCLASPVCIVVGGSIVIIGAVALAIHIANNPPQISVNLPDINGSLERGFPGATLALQACTAVVQVTSQRVHKLAEAYVNSLPEPKLGRDWFPPLPTPDPQHIFYFKDVDPYPWPGRDTNQLVSYLSDYENVIRGVWGVRSQLEKAQREYNKHGDTFRMNELMGRKFEAERVIFYADQAALGSANSTAAGVDLFPINFGPIQFIQVKWSNTSLSCQYHSKSSYDGSELSIWHVSTRIEQH